MTNKCDVILAGVGGQGVLSLSSIIGLAALRDGLHVKQNELHGMAQRGGAVSAHLRISEEPIASDLIPIGGASLILSMEPLESLRYLDFLSPDGTVITSVTPVINIPDYPDITDLLAQIENLPSSILVEGEHLAKKAGSTKSSNVVLVGAAAHLVPVTGDTIERCINDLFARKGQEIVDINIRAFRLGKEASLHRAPE